MAERGVDNIAESSDKHFSARKKKFNKPPPKTPAERQRKYRLKKKLMKEARNILTTNQPSESAAPVIAVQSPPSSPEVSRIIEHELPTDMKNYMEYHIMNSVSQIRMKPDCMQSKFHCQSDNRKMTNCSLERPYDSKTQRLMPIEECLNESVKTNIPSTSGSSLVGKDTFSIDQAIKIEPMECYDEETPFTNLCEDVKIEIIEEELPITYEPYEDIDIEVPGNFQAPTEPCATASTNLNINQNTKNGCIEETTNINKCMNEIIKKEIIDIEPSLIKEEKTIKKLPESDDELRNSLFYNCEMCDVKYLSEALLKAHMRLHDENRKFQCNVCGYRYKTRGALVTHIKSHAETIFDCDTCGYKSKMKTQFDQHMKQKHGGKYQAPKNPCDKALTNSNIKLNTKNGCIVISTNIEKCINEKKITEIPADKNINDITGSSQKYTTARYMDDNQSQNKVFVNTLYHYCTVCEYKSFDKYTLDRHMKLHDLDRKYQCDVCLHRFKKRHELYRHKLRKKNCEKE